MKLLLGCVNSSHSLVGYDWDAGQIFWALPTQELAVCGICYDGEALCVSGNNTLTRLDGQDRRDVALYGRYDALAHSVHPMEQGRVGVVDTGNSRILVFGPEGQPCDAYTPLNAWGDLPHDAVHLNDFAVTPIGVLASCFDYRPWRSVREQGTWEDWCTGGYGLILNVTGQNGSGAGRVVGSGFNHPHSLTWHEDRLLLCSSASGTFHACEITEFGQVVETRRWEVSDDHFVRGVLFDGDCWILGGSSTRHGEVLSRTTELYRLDPESGDVETRTVGGPGEIYDILPWRADLMDRILPRHFAQSEQERMMA